MSVEDLRSWLEIGDGELSAVKDLRKRAIDVSKAELDNKADLTFRYEAIKAGRRITGWTFKVKENRPRPVQREFPLRVDPELNRQPTAGGRAALSSIKAALKGN
jgi:plasmid replication initiation protein